MMRERLYLCHHCGSIFRSTADVSNPPGTRPPCPHCGDSQIRELPSWVPAGSDLNHAPAAWEYECQVCRERFKLPIPRSPSQEKNISCPVCCATHIHRLTPAGYEPLYCG
jgi:DNA-directed RNA polymerase subunit RPC12/RpoP